MLFHACSFVFIVFFFISRYFLVDFNSPPTAVSAIKDHLGRDIDVIRSSILKHHVANSEECMGMIPVSTEDKLTKMKK